MTPTSSCQSSALGVLFIKVKVNEVMALDLTSVSGNELQQGLKWSPPMKAGHWKKIYSSNQYSFISMTKFQK